LEFKALILSGCLASGFAYANAPKPTPEMLEKGKKTFTTTCVACHGEKGEGNGMAAGALNPPPRNFAEPFKQGSSPEEIFKTLSQGVPGSAMVSFSYLPESDRWALAYYVLDLKKPGSVLGKTKAKK
jgi:mono/diheme cytochrome c family protein